MIVGTGAAGYAVAEGLHTGGFDGAVTLIGEETDDPYDRPPLSKEILSGAWDQPRAALIAAKRVAAMNPTLVTGVRADGLDVADHSVRLNDGRTLAYDAVVVATGIIPRRIAHPASPNIRVLRTMQDSLGLRALLLGRGLRLLVIGAGFLGLEVAATAHKLGAEIIVVEPVAGPPLASRVGTVAAERLLATHEANGVQIRTGVGVADLAIEADGSVAATLSDGAVVHADVVLVAVGSVPATDWLADSGLTIDNGVVCDEFCSAGEGVWAAGDVASWLHVGYGRRMRLEHRTNAQEQGYAVARNILGAGEPFVPIPYFWTDHYDVRIQLSGLIPDNPEIAIVDGSATDEKFVQTFSTRGRLQAVLAWNSPRGMAEYRKQLIAAPA